MHFHIKNHKVKRMSINETLGEMLKDDDLTALRFFSPKNIVTDVKNNIQTFVSYALRHKKFIFQCLQIALETPFADLQKQNKQSTAFKICQILCCDQPVMADLFFQPTSNQQRKNSQISQNIEGQQAQSIQTQAERLFCDDEEDLLKKLQKTPIQILKNQIATKTLSILKSINNQSSLGYLYKIWSFLIRNNSNQVIQFFNSNRQCFQLLISNLRFPSVSNLVAQIIVCEDRSKEYRYEKFKKQIIQRIVQILIQKKQDSELFEGVCILLEEVFNSSKQSYCENFDDFKRQVNYFFSSPIIQQLYSLLFENNQKSFQNALKYLELLLTRMNSQKQDADNWREEHNQPFVKFQTDILITNFPELITLLKKIQGFNSIVKISFVSVLIQVVQTNQFQNLKAQLNLIEIFDELMAIFSSEKSKGIFKMKISKLIEKVIICCSTENIEAFITKKEDFFAKFYPMIQSISMENSRTYNKNQLIGFQFQILFQIENKLPGVVDTSSRVNQKNLKRIQKKYETKIANYGRPNQPINLQELGTFTFNQIPALRLPEGFKINNFNTERKGPQSCKTKEDKKPQEDIFKGSVTQKETVDEKSGEQKVVDEKSGEQKVLDEKSEEQKVVDEKSGEQKLLDEKSEEQKLLDEKSEEQKIKIALQIELKKDQVREGRKEEQEDKGIVQNKVQKSEDRVSVQKSQQVIFYIKHNQLMK